MILRLYARFSPRRDANECESCENQLNEQKEWADTHHPDIPRVEYADKDISGGSADNREDFQRIIEECEKGDIVVVRNLERFARNFEDTIIYVVQLRKKGVRLYSLESGFYEENHNRAQQLLSMIKAKIAEWDREDKAAATKQAMQKMVLRGEYTGGRPQYGYDKVQDGFRITEKGMQVPKYKAVPNLSQQSCITYIMQQYKANASINDILINLRTHWRMAQPKNSVFTKRLISRIIERETKRSGQSLKNLA